MSKILIAIIIVLAGFMFYRSWNNGKLAEVNQAQGDAFLQQNAQKEGIITTKSGLQYEVIQAGTGTEHPTKTSKVTVHYHGTLIDGTVFDSSVERGQPITFKLSQVIKGWQEGLQYMVKGEKVRLYIPSKLGYGKGGQGPIPPASVLIFDVELIDIQ